MSEDKKLGGFGKEEVLKKEGKPGNGDEELDEDELELDELDEARNDGNPGNRDLDFCIKKEGKPGNGVEELEDDEL